MDHIRCGKEIRGAIERLIGHVVVVDSVENIPSPVPEDTAFVTRGGVLAGLNGCMEFWMPGTDSANPLSRKHSVTEATSALTTTRENMRKHETSLTAILTEMESLNNSLSEAGQMADERRHRLAQKEGESQVVSREAKESR